MVHKVAKSILSLSRNHVFRSDHLNSWIADLRTGEPFPLNKSAKDLLIPLLEQTEIFDAISTLKEKYNSNIKGYKVLRKFHKFTGLARLTLKKVET